MQYILTEEEYKKLKEEDSKFKELCMILYNIDSERIDTKSKFLLFSKLSDDLAYSEQDGNTEAVLFAWNNRKSQEDLKNETELNGLEATLGQAE